MRNGLTKIQLQVIAIFAMVCDHYAWAFLDFFSIPGQLLHIIGRLTLPIMCFCIAEGIRQTSNLRKYICRMGIFCVISTIPFYLFFHKMYGYRQNILFDLLLGLLLVTALEHPTFRKWQKVLLSILLFATSGLIGGWPILPLLFILIFYYKKDFTAKAKWFCGVNIGFVSLLIITIRFNEYYHFSSYNWVWYDKLYLYGFMLALLPLRAYNGHRGNYPIAKISSKKMLVGRYFFYCFYPLHFLALYGIQQLLAQGMHYPLYFGLHLLVLLAAVITVIKLMLARPSRAQTYAVFLGIFAIVYLMGFILEISTDSLPAICTAITMEYFGELLLFIGVTLFIAEFSHFDVPRYIYSAEAFMSFLILVLVFTAPQNHIFYREMQMDYSGPFPRIALEYGFGFYIFIAYVVALCIGFFVMFIQYYCQTSGIEHKRISCLVLAVLCPWLPLVLRTAGLTGGYEISGLGVLGSELCLAIALLKYDYFDSIQVARENALNHGNEGIMVINPRKRILYYNHIMEEIFPDIRPHKNAYMLPHIEDIIENNLKRLPLNDKVYDMRVEPLIEAGYVQGYMLWAIEMTEHYKKLDAAENNAHTDALTGLINRNYFYSCVNEHFRLGGTGAMFMLDLDNFKQVNDSRGHSVGDTVLLILSDTMKKVTTDQHLACRMGGDEFSMFFKDITDKKELTSLAEDIIHEFKEALSNAGHTDLTSLSLGISILRSSKSSDTNDIYEQLYRKADRALYMSKNSGKDSYKFYR